MMSAMPERYGNKLRQWLWAAFKSGALMSFCERQLRAVLAQGAARKPGASTRISLAGSA